jgi:hypothetical protein
VQSLQLHFESPPELATFRTRLERTDNQRFADILRLLGLTEAGPPIRVVLATESSDWAREVAPWVAGFAVGASSLVVIFPTRSPSYPHTTLEDVLRHEIAHILVRRAAGGGSVPRWFNEGLAMAAERERRFQDQTQLLYQLVTGSRPDLAELDRLFAGGQQEQVRAYAIAGALVHDVMNRHGATSCAHILARLNRGDSFEEAFRNATGVTPSADESDFWQRQRLWTTWVPIITSGTTVWLAITLLALLAIYRRRRRNREIERRWEEEGEMEDEQDVE